MNAFAPARDAADRAAVRHARRIAFRLSLGFLVLCSLYILFSSRLAPRWFPSLEEVAAFEVLKGLAFMVTISVIFYAFASRLLARNALQQEELRRQQEALELSGRRATAGLVASTVAHDMNNVLTVALLHLEALAKADPEAVAEGRMRLQRALDDLAKQARRLAALGQGVGPSSAGPAVPLDLCALAGTVLDFARHHPDLRGCHVLLKDREPARLRGQPRLLGHLLLNLLLNAGAATRGCGRIEIRCRPEPGEPTASP